MRLAARLEQLVPDLSATLLRFPVPVALSIALCLYFNVAGVSGSSGEMVMAGAAAAFFGAGAAHLYAEGAKLGRFTGIALALTVAVITAITGYFTRVFSTNLLFLFGGLLPVLMIAPYLRRGVAQGAIWLFNLRLGLAALLAFVVALLFAAGLSAIAEALHILFGARIGDFHEHVWFTAMSLVAPLYGLSLMPRDLDEEVDVAHQRGSLLDRGISVLVNYVAVPVIVIYAAILHAYAVKIVIDGELPKGQIATIVSIFAVGGTGVWLVAWPWRDLGTRLLRLFIRLWFFLLIVPAVLLTLAIWRRLADYGVTPERYGIALVAIWVAALAVYLAIRRNQADMRAILGAAAVLLLVGSVGPMGANGLAGASQYARLKGLLERAGVLDDGKLQSAPKLPGEIAVRGSSIVYALKDADGLYRLAPWFRGDPKDPFAGNQDPSGWAVANAVNERLGFVPAATSADYVNFNANKAQEFAVPPGARLFGPFTVVRVYGNAPPQAPMTARADESLVIIRLPEETYRVPQRQLLERTKAQLANRHGLQGMIVIEIAPGSRLLIDQINGNLADDTPLANARFWIIRQQQP